MAWRDVHSSRHAEMSPDVIGAVAIELHARGRRRRYYRALRWTGGACAGAAAVIGAVALVASHGRERPGRLDRMVAAGESAPGGEGATGAEATRASRLLLVLEETNSASRSPLPDRFVSAGDTFRAGEHGTVRIGSAAGTEVVVEPGGVLHVLEVDATKKFALLLGAVHVRVAKLLPGERFIIETAHTKVEVHGTQFRVSLVDGAPGCGGMVTKVSVSEGVVSVDSAGQGERLLPGDDWTSKCAPSPAPEQDQPGSRRKLARRRSLSKARLGVGAANVARMPAANGGQLDPGGSTSLAAAPSASQLAAQNDLFASAVRAKRDGRAEDALLRFDRFVRQYPGSSLVESALVHRMRVLAWLDRRAAVEAATGYLRRFPDGFARGEAQLLLNAPAKP